MHSLSVSFRVQEGLEALAKMPFVKSNASLLGSHCSLRIFHEAHVRRWERFSEALSQEVRLERLSVSLDTSKEAPRGLDLAEVAAQRLCSDVDGMLCPGDGDSSAAQTVRVVSQFGSVCDVGARRHLYSARFVEAVGSDSVREVTPVPAKDAERPAWCDVRWQQQSYIRSECFWPEPVLAPDGSEYWATQGVLIARPDTELSTDVAEEAVGWGKLREERIILLRTGFAKELRRSLRRLKLAPVFATDGPTAQATLRVLSCLRAHMSG